MTKPFVESHLKKEKERIAYNNERMLLLNCYISGAYIFWVILHNVWAYFGVDIERPLPGGIFVGLILVLNVGTIFEQRRSFTSAFMLDHEAHKRSHENV